MKSRRVRRMIGVLLAAGVILFPSSAGAATWSQSKEKELAANSLSGIVIHPPGDAGISDAVYPTVHSPDANTVLLLHFEEESWNGAANQVIDSSGRENHGTARGGATTTANGRFGRAGEFDGNDDSVVIGDHDSLDPGAGPWTAEAWVYVTETTAPGYIPFHKGQNVGGNENWRMQIQGATGGNELLFCWASGSGELDQVHAEAIPRNKWVHAAFTFDGTVNGYALYVNGRRSDARLEVDQPVGAIETSNALVVGSSQTGLHSFKGVLDEVRISNIARYTGDVIPDVPATAGAIISRTINSGEPVLDIRLDWEETLPAGSSITCSATNDGGAHWYELPGKNELFTFPRPGNDLRVRAELKRKNDTPILHGWKAEFTADPSYAGVTGEAIPGAQVTLRTPDGSIYAGAPQENPRIVDSSCRYFFYARKGRYYVTAALNRFKDYTSPVFTVGADPVQVDLKLERADDSRRIIFNCDGAGVFLNSAGNVDRWIKNMFDPLAGSHVDSFFWCDGAGGNTVNYVSDVLELTGARIDDVDPDLARWIEEGIDPPEVVVREARKRGLEVFYSFRMNDIHDHYIPHEFPTFKEEHPEWMLGDLFDEFPTSLDFAVPEVRELKLRTIEELFRKYDFDGLEIDFMRFPRYFRAFEEYRHAVIVTDFLRTVRQRLNERAAERGRPVTLAVRVDENLTACRLDGFDIDTWVREGLIDMLIIADLAFPDGRDIQAFKQLVRGTPIQIYVCVARPSRVIGASAEVIRGLAANYWQQGADGMYTFNWFPHTSSSATALLKEIGDPRVLAPRNKIFPADCSEHGPGRTRVHPSMPRFHNWLFASLPVTLSPVWNPESFTVIPVDVADDVNGPRAEKVKALRLLAVLKNLVPGDVVDVNLNGHPLGPMPEPAGDGLITFGLSPDHLQVGRNEVGLRLDKRGPRAEDDIVLDAVEIHVDYE